MPLSPFAALDTFEWSTPFLADACAELKLPVRQGPPALSSVIAGARVFGPVAPAVHAGSPDVILEAIATASRGDVLIIDNNGRVDESCVGEPIAAEAFMFGLAALIVDGAHRDSGALRAIGLPIWSRGRAASGPLELRRRHATALEAATCGSITVTREDAVFADEDGVLFVAVADCARVIDAARSLATRERALAARVLAGEPLRDQLRLAEYLMKRDEDAEYSFRRHLEGL